MLHSKLNQSLIIRMMVVLALLAGIGLATWLLSTPRLRASSGLAPLTFTSPIGNPQFGLDKTVNNSSPASGEQISYTLSYSNTRPGSQAFNVRLYDFLPAGVQFISSNPPATLEPNGVLLFTAPSVGPSTGNTNVTVRVRVREGHSQLVNHALVVADGVTPTVASLLTTILQPSSNWLRLVKLGYSAVLPGSQLVYTLQATNLGTATLNDVTVVDVMPGGLPLLSASPPPDLATLPMLRWSLGTLAPMQSKLIVITTTAPAATGSITNSAVAGAFQNVVTQTLFSTQIVTNVAILRVAKSGSAPAVDLGDTLVYTLRYSNAGNQVATTVRLTDTLPAHLTVVGTSPAPTSQTAQQLVWNLGTLNAGAQGQVVITTTVGGAGGRVLHNIAHITGQAGSYPGYAELDTPVRLVIMHLPIIRR
ncbi:hypothetical protein TFLX_00340 [Thermoflexales bacterium]|nr:hypothetical protein TFLX_00340 [Thermoflexales bacterium]